MTWDGQVPCHPVEIAGCVYVEVPKAGCTSVKWALSPFKGGPPTAGSADDVHRWFGYTYAAHPKEMQDWLAGRWKDLFRFTVVRDPIARFESFYYEKLPWYEREVHGSINRYVMGVFEHDGWRLNPHTVPQTAFIGRDLSMFDYVGRTEDMVDLGAVLSERLGRTIDVPHLNRTEGDREVLSKRAVARLHELYRVDYQVLGY